MKNKGLKRLITGLAIGLLGVLILFPYSCAPKRVQVVYDKEGNLSGAKDLGMQVLHFKDISQLKKDLKSLGITWT